MQQPDWLRYALNEGVSLERNCGAALVGVIIEDNLVSSTGLIIWIGHCKADVSSFIISPLSEIFNH